MPLNVSGMVFSDTLLNTAAILQAQGIKKVLAIETKSNTPSYWTREYTVTNGLVVANRSCFRRSRDNDSGFCIPRDTMVYNDERMLTDYWMGPVKDSAILQCRVQYLQGGKRVYTWISTDPKRNRSDIDVYHFQWNEKKQLIRTKTISGKNNVDASLYYNVNGFLDSIRNDDRSHGAYIFNHKKKGKKTEISADGPTSIYYWLYNEKGQCLSSYWSVKPRPGASKKYTPLFSSINYSYNDDGTLAKVVEKSNNNATTVLYSYLK